MLPRLSHWPCTSTSPATNRYESPSSVTSQLSAGTWFTDTACLQVHVGGEILPQVAGEPSPSSDELVGFDGIAMFLYPSADVLVAMLSHPYYTDIVEPDERVFIDKSAPGGGMVATYIGKHVEAVNRGHDVWLGDRETIKKYQDIFNTY